MFKQVENRKGVSSVMTSIPDPSKWFIDINSYKKYIKEVILNRSPTGFCQQENTVSKYWCWALLISENDVKTSIQAIGEEKIVNEPIADDGGTRLLHVAVQSGQIEAVKYLLTIPNVEVNITDRLYRTPLLFAFRVEFFCYDEDKLYGLCKLLIDNGAEELPNEEDEKCIYYAAIYGYESIMKLLLEKFSKRYSVLNYYFTLILLKEFNHPFMNLIFDFIEKEKLNIIFHCVKGNTMGQSKTRPILKSCNFCFLIPTNFI